jgi:hypothetical protein
MYIKLKHGPKKCFPPHNSETTGPIAEIQTVLEPVHRGEGPIIYYYYSYFFLFFWFCFVLGAMRGS